MKIVHKRYHGWMKKNRKIVNDIVMKNPAKIFKGLSIDELIELTTMYKGILHVYDNVLASGRRLTPSQQEEYAKIYGLHRKAYRYVEVLRSVEPGPVVK